MLILNATATQDLDVNTNPIAGYPYSSEALQVTSDNGQLVKLANVLVPLDRPSSIKITNTRIADVYQTLAKGAIPLGQQAANPTGQSIFIELSAVAASDTVGQTGILLPVVGRLELRLPNHGELTEEFVLAVISATYGAALGISGVPRFIEMMRGVLHRD